MNLAAGVCLALASTLLLNYGLYAQHGAAGALPTLTLRHPIRSLLALFTNRAWLEGYGLSMLGWAFYLLALHFAPISLVQALSAGGVGVLVLLVHRDGHQLTKREWTAVSVCLAGVIALTVSCLAGVSSSTIPPTTTAVIWLAVLAAGALIAIWPVSSLLRPGIGFGLAAGLFYAAGDIASKDAVSGAVVFIPALVAGASLGFVMLQLAYQRGSALATAGMSTLFNNSIPVIGGVVLFNEHVPHGVLGGLRVASFVLVIGGAVLLARPETESETAAEAHSIAD